MSEEFGPVHEDLMKEAEVTRATQNYLGQSKRRLVRLREEADFNYVDILPKLCTGFDSAINVILLLQIQQNNEVSLIIGKTGTILGFTEGMISNFDKIESFYLKPL